MKEPKEPELDAPLEEWEAWRVKLYIYLAEYNKRTMRISITAIIICVISVIILWLN